LHRFITEAETELKACKICCFFATRQVCFAQQESLLFGKTMITTATPKIVISGSGVWTPANVITNEELVKSYNAYAERFNADHATEIAAGRIEEKFPSSERFIEKTSGIKARHVYTREGILDIDRMRPHFPERKDEELSNQA